MTVAVVILNWNGAQHLRTYLPSVVAHSSGASLVIADNGSSDDSKVVVDEYETVEWLDLGENFGFAEGYNRALAKVDAEVVVLLNSDVRVTEGWLEGPMRRLRDDAKVAAVQPKILADSQPNCFEYAGASGGYLDALGIPYCRGRIFETLEQDVGQYDGAVQVDWASGACCFVRASAFHRVGGLDGSYFAHMEEIDLCWRLRNHDFTCWVEPSSTVYHLGGGSLNYGSPRKTYLNVRNSLTTLVKNTSGVQTAGKLGLRSVVDLAAAFRFVLQGQYSQALSIGRGHLSFYSKLSSTLRYRKAAFAKTGFAGRPSTGPVKSILTAYYIKGRTTFEELGR